MVWNVETETGGILRNVYHQTEIGDNDDQMSIRQKRNSTDDSLSPLEDGIPYLADWTVVAIDKSLIESLLQLYFRGLWVQPFYRFVSGKMFV